MTSDDWDRAHLFYRDLFFESLVNIKAVNSGIYNQYICDMDEKAYAKWADFVQTLKETGWIP